jgi:hypothetical protein
MKKITTILLSLMSTALIAQIPNPSFENWSGGNPVGWTDGNSFAPGSTTQSATAHAGSSACSLNNFGGAGGFVVTGSYSGSVFFPITGNPAAINGYYILNVVSGEGLNVSVTTKQGSSNNGAGTLNITTATAVYKQFSACVHIGSGTADSCSILIQLTGSPTHSGAYVIVDDLSIGACVNAVDEISHDVTLEPSYPNPASTICNIIYSIPSEGTVNVNLYDISGRKVMNLLNDTKQTDGRYKIPVDVTNLANGVYIYKVTVNGQSYSQKLTVAK